MLRIVTAYRTVSTSAILVLASVPPIGLLAEEGKETFQLRKELTCLTNLLEIARAKEAIRKDGRRRLVEKRQTRWHGDQSGRWTHRLIPELATWLDRKHGQVGFHLAQALSGHGCFNAYLKRFKKRDDESCCCCGSLLENAEHTLFVCVRWGAKREAVGRAVGAQLIPDTMVSLMLQSEQICILIGSFLTLIMKTRELLRLRRTWPSALIGEESFYSSPCLARLVCLPNGRVSSDGRPGRTDDGRVERDFRLERTSREV